MVFDLVSLNYHCGRQQLHRLTSSYPGPVNLKSMPCIFHLSHSSRRLLATTSCTLSPSYLVVSSVGNSHIIQFLALLNTIFPYCLCCNTCPLPLIYQCGRQQSFGCHLTSFLSLCYIMFPFVTQPSHPSLNILHGCLRCQIQTGQQRPYQPALSILHRWRTYGCSLLHTYLLSPNHHCGRQKLYLSTVT